MSKEEATEALAKFEKEFFKLNEGQYNTVFNLLTSRDQFQAIQGVAGAGARVHGWAKVEKCRSNCRGHGPVTHLIPWIPACAGMT